MESTSPVAIASLATQLANQRNRNAVEIAVLKRALDLSGQSALQLVEAAARSWNPPHLGTIIDTWA